VAHSHNAFGNPEDLGEYLRNTYHHFPEPPAYLRRVARALRPDGRIAIIDFHEKIARDQIVRDAGLAGLRAIAEHEFLPQQHFVVFS